MPLFCRYRKEATTQAEVTDGTEATEYLRLASAHDRRAGRIRVVRVIRVIRDFFAFLCLCGSRCQSLPEEIHLFSAPVQSLLRLHTANWRLKTGN